MLDTPLRVLLSVMFVSRALSECIWALSADPAWFNALVARSVSKQNDGSTSSRIASLLMAVAWVWALWLLWRREV